MAGNTRGKLKEHFEGIHKNFDWIHYHNVAALGLIAEHKPHLSDSIKYLDTAICELDKLTQRIYSQL